MKLENSQSSQESELHLMVPLGQLHLVIASLHPTRKVNDAILSSFTN